jgi:hypothetical protein
MKRMMMLAVAGVLAFTFASASSSAVDSSAEQNCRGRRPNARYA